MVCGACVKGGTAIQSFGPNGPWVHRTRTMSAYPSKQQLLVDMVRPRPNPDRLGPAPLTPEPRRPAAEHREIPVCHRVTVGSSYATPPPPPSPTSSQAKHKKKTGHDHRPGGRLAPRPHPPPERLRARRRQPRGFSPAPGCSRDLVRRCSLVTLEPDKDQKGAERHTTPDSLVVTDPTTSPALYSLMYRGMSSNPAVTDYLGRRNRRLNGWQKRTEIVRR